MHRSVLLALLLGLAATCGAPAPSTCAVEAGSACIPEGNQCTLASPSRACTCTSGVLVCHATDAGTP
jgi:hypothetical protein